ncbi:MAG: alpha/beta hydrolase [Henriciella sp.]|uniref:alpha/beta hydrolase family protein n=1 Tax=Henriciella sp. TaxID=1968823 RepID=UPI0032EF7748
MTDSEGVPMDAANQPAAAESGNGTALEGLMRWPDLLSQPIPQPSRTLQIGPDAETDLVDIWLPEGAGLHPTVLMIHGGCWQKEIADRTIMNYAAEALRQEGVAVWNIEYRGVDEEGGGYPGTFLDVARAVDALGERGRSLGLNTNRIVAFGHSAGGHLAVWAAARENLPETSPLYSDDPLHLAGVVNSGGLADLEASAPITDPGCLADIMDQLTGPPSESRADVFSDTSPAALLPVSSKIISVNGAQDRIAPPELGRALTEKVREAGGEADFVNVPVSGHVELIAPGTLAFDIETVALKRLLGLETETAD